MVVGCGKRTGHGGGGGADHITQLLELVDLRHDATTFSDGDLTLVCEASQER